MKIFFLIFFYHIFIMAGGDHVGNGTDAIDPHDEISWFADSNRTIHYCFEASSLFSVPSETIRMELDLVFRTWFQYIERRFPQNNYLPTKAQALPQCTGAEDIKFFMGLKHQKIGELRKIHPRSFAVSYLENYDLQKRWGQGIVWLPEDNEAPLKNFHWSLQKNLRGVLLHEVGHVLGCQHLENTIMDRKIFQLLATDSFYEPQQEKLFSSIDHTHYLLAPLASFETFPQAKQTSGDILVQAFQRLLGYTPTQPDSLRATLFKTDFTKNLILHLEDQGQKYEFPFQFQKLISQSTRSSSLFQTYAQGVVEGLQSSTYSFLGSFKTPRGLVPVIINLNGKFGLEIQSLDGTEYNSILFIAESPFER